MSAKKRQADFFWEERTQIEPTQSQSPWHTSAGFDWAHTPRELGRSKADRTRMVATVAKSRFEFMAGDGRGGRDLAVDLIIAGGRAKGNAKVDHPETGMGPTQHQ